MYPIRDNKEDKKQINEKHDHAKINIYIFIELLQWIRLSFDLVNELNMLILTR